MKQLRVLPLSLALTIPAFLSSLSSAQSTTTSSPSDQPAPSGKPLPSDLSGASYKTTTIPQVDVITPFALNVPAAQQTNPLVYLPPDQMSDADRTLVLNSHSEVSADATLAGLELNVGKWSYQQLVCKALPD